MRTYGISTAAVGHDVIRVDTCAYMYRHLSATTFLRTSCCEILFRRTYYILSTALISCDAEVGNVDKDAFLRGRHGLLPHDLTVTHGLNVYVQLFSAHRQS